LAVLLYLQTDFGVFSICCAGSLYFVDAMSSFGAVPLDASASHIDFLVSSANKCVEGVPGWAYAVCREEALRRCQGKSE
jgi:2-aminoethylphosphonate-pyruvate transaminase